MKPTNELPEAFRAKKVAGWKCVSATGNVFIVPETRRSIPGHLAEGQVFDWRSMIVWDFTNMTSQMIKTVEVVSDISQHAGRVVRA